jgi:signal peptidase I
VDLELNFEKRYRLVREIIETLVLTVLMFLIIRLAVQNFTIDGTSMELSLHNQELVIVDKWSYIFNTPARGDVIVFVAPPEPTEDFIKRVIGLPGDIITVHGKQVIVDGKTLSEAYVDPGHQGNPFASVTNIRVPQGSYFVMGDNRSVSFDSRAWGCLPKENIIGRAALVYWPFNQNNLGLVPGVSSTYTGITTPPKSMTSTSTCPVMHLKPATSTAASSTLTQQKSPLSTASILILPCAFVGVSRRKRRSQKKALQIGGKLVGLNIVVDRTKGSEENLWI